MTRLQEIQRNTLMAVAGVPERYITHTGLIEVNHFLRDRNIFIERVLYQQLSRKDVDEVWIYDEKFQGRYITRLTNYLHKICSVKLSQEDHEKLAMIIALNTFGATNETYYDVVNFIRWRPGSFKESPSSCWWGMYKDGKAHFIDEMKRNEAAAIRLFRPATPQEIATKGLKKWYGGYVGMGRCFAIVDNPKEVDIIFNGYGLELKDWKNFLIYALGYSYSSEVKNLSLYRYTYINGNTGIALYDNPQHSVVEYHDPLFGVHEPLVCHQCGEKYRTEKCMLCHWKHHTRLYSNRIVLNEEVIKIQLSDRWGSVPIATCKEELDSQFYIKCAEPNCENYMNRFTKGVKCHQHR